MGVVIRPADRPGDLGWIVQAHGELYARELGWDASFERMVANVVGELDPEDDAVWIAELDGRRVGCVSCVTGDDGEAVLRILLVHPDGRGHGIGSRLVDTCLAHARERGFKRLRLWTTNRQATAREVYLRRGFVLVDEQPQRRFGADVVGETYRLELV
ncbi:GNAT family N-acetyltransferase [Kutzneria buriramensis]|uniref:N-acetylglutamate synthase-like GNAT family acetyltransferase n=1 Tax=Kutzneria buriramensis TaxID=1045776 RepID=A0A3E0HLB0_9PSEU|nr:GNAT family N-acetyltransferase [Kutzneria buriramensis]REH47207.1 N-acetylglutamate synthase-like GNAT family acetyltransferase [Kutzneria buriramensis]